MSEREDLVRRLQEALEAVIARFGSRYTATMPEHGDLCELDDAVKEAADYITSNAEYVRGLELGADMCVRMARSESSAQHGREASILEAAAFAIRALKPKAQAEESSAPQVSNPVPNAPASTDKGQPLGAGNTDTGELPAAADDQHTAEDMSGPRQDWLHHCWQLADELERTLACIPSNPPASPAPEVDEEAFAAWLESQMPPGTVISDPKWWAPRILRAVGRKP